MDQELTGELQVENRNFTPNLPAPDLTALRHIVIHYSGTNRLSYEFRQAAGDIHRGRAYAFKAACLLLADLADQGWDISLGERGLQLAPPTSDPGENDPVDSVKNRLRMSLQVARNRQLSESSVRQFLRGMERRRQFNGRQVSILDLVDDGPSLASELARVAQLPIEERLSATAHVIKPVVEVCTEKKRCKYTGLLLQDVWRYFRHTWSLEYRPTPSRKFMILVRNAARPMAPVMGIAMISNAPTYLEERDKWIGWRLDDIVKQLRLSGEEAQSIACRLVKSIQDAILLVRTDDLLEPKDLEEPTEHTVKRLRAIASEATARRMEALRDLEDRGEVSSRSKHLPVTQDGEVDWRVASESPLFLRKRATTLASLLSAKRAFQKVGAWDDPCSNYAALLRSTDGRKAIAVALGEIRKVALSSNLMDVGVCGAVPPYGELLGGKLVAMLLSSHEISQAYTARYGHQASVIASQIKGSPVTRPSELLMLTTTSLYSVGSSQYNRLVLRSADHPELDNDLIWKRLGVTKGFGTAHLSKETVSALRDLSRTVHKARRINNIFGEGTSPRMRQIREGLEALGVSSDALLKHSTPRIVYALELVPGAKRRLCGLDPSPMPSKPGTNAIVRAWLRRWIVKRVGNSAVIDRLASFSRRQVQEQLLTNNSQTQLDI